MLRLLLAIATCAAIGTELDDAPSEVSLLQVNLELGQHNKLENTESLRTATGHTYWQKLRNSDDTHYLGEIKVGNQTIKGILDTGSFDLVVTSNRCWACLSTHKYNPDLSQSFIQGNGKVHASEYGSGVLIDTLAYEKVEMGDGRFVAEKLPFYMVFGHVMPIMLGADFAAVIGMGRDGASQKTNNSTEASLPEALKPDTRQFSHCLGREPGSPGWWIWDDVIPPNAVSLRVKAELFWATDMHSTKLSTGLDLGCGAGCAALLDSGTSLLTAPPSVVEMIDNELEKLDADCNNFDTLPDLEFTLDGKDFRLPPEIYIGFVVGEIDSSIKDLMSPPPKEMKCRALIMKVDMMSQFGPGWILGMPFFKEYYTTFSSSPHGVRDGMDRIYTTIAGDDCTPSSGTVLTDVGGAGRKAKRLRTVPASTIRVNPWIIKAAANGGRTHMTL